MSISFTEVRGQAMGIDVDTSVPTAANSLVTGRIYLDSSTGALYVYDGSKWMSAIGGTSTSTSTTSSSSSSTSTTSTSSSSSSSSTSSTSSSSSSSSTSTTLY